MGARQERGNRERGSVVVLMTAGVFLVGLFMVGLARLGAGAAERAQARTAADAAALAGAAEGREAAAEVAEANGASLARFDEEGEFVEVEVDVGEARAVARAKSYGMDAESPELVVPDSFPTLSVARPADTAKRQG